ncbi:aminotransferase class I/II-fold pyridoxal phosphate-dependent enzyme [Halalkalibacter akibai]|uniref:Arginine decarboxylase n=1 Tax=Halalkalibacter akibai (strain ATCC 43226 / DSM 21942 / CIP 109018 / JCM 9157 / 1139) TaxID=1236973 RepID=W4QY22_HALA3|nr:aminotransferase class V-fold PLP-dependent enzyme [Halalkalibacter akibai]GAE36543.1 arginine decarboxylase [Halalkalibacter akibai JCM 9157]
METPLIDALKKHLKQRPFSLHVPGHKNGEFFHPSMSDFSSVFTYDLTELEGLDDLHAPTGVIQEAQQAVSRLYNTKESLFLVGGTTVGNIAMMYGLFEPGDTIFIQRNSHKSIFHAVQIADLTPALLTPEFDAKTGLAVGLTLETLKEAINLYPEAKGLVLTYPNYYGSSLNINQLISYAKQQGLLVLVDEAHAPHYCLGMPFPPSALEQGADITVQSAHKMLPALTMSSFLHMSNKLPDSMQQRVKEALTMFQSSSPSYLLMASLDGARAYVESLDKKKINEIMAGIQQVKEELALIKQIQVVEWDESYLLDPLKVTIRTTTKLSGFELQKIFYKHCLYTELADDKHVLLVFGLGKSQLPMEVIRNLAKDLSQYEVLDQEFNKKPISFSRRVKKLELTAKQIRSLRKKRILLEEAIGYVAAEAIIPYPPGVPIVLPGEKLDESVISEIQTLKRAGARFQSEKEVTDVLVIDSEEENE